MSEFYSKLHEKAVKSRKPLGKAHAAWMHDLLKRLYDYWQEPDTPLPHIDLFDEVAKAVEDVKPH